MENSPFELLLIITLHESIKVAPFVTSLASVIGPKFVSANLFMKSQNEATMEELFSGKAEH
jgi:hypothetical protein